MFIACILAENIDFGWKKFRREKVWIGLICLQNLVGKRLYNGKVEIKPELF